MDGSKRPKLTFEGDLGVQRGVLRWILSLHQPEYRIETSPKKLQDPTADPQTAEGKSKPKPKSTKPVAGKRAKAVSASAAAVDSDQDIEPEADELPSSSNGLAGATSSGRLGRAPTLPSPDASSVLPAVAASLDVLCTPRRRDTDVAAGFTPGALGLPSIPSPLTPSITQVLSRALDAAPPPPLPAGLTVASLKSRLDGKKKIKCVGP